MEQRRGVWRLMVEEDIEMGEHTRRQFLRRTAAGGTVAMGAGASAFGAEEPAEMCIARWGGPAVSEEAVNAMATKLTEQAMAAIGGMGRFVKKGDSVWVKPNMAWSRKPEQAANTNPAVVGSLVKQCFDAGAGSVKVGDVTVHPAKQAYPASGIEALAEKAGAEVVYIDPKRCKEMDVGGKVVEKWKVCPEIVESDVVVNVPVLKQHKSATATMCMKNLMGVVTGRRDQWHQALGDCLCDITEFVKPAVNVLDAVRILVANGPTGGNLEDVRRKDIVAASTDIVAIDAFAATLLEHAPEDISSVKVGHERGLGEIDYGKLAREIAVT